MNYSDWSDAELIAASLSDSHLFGIIFDRHGKAIARYFSSRLDIQDADEAFGEAFRIAFEKRGKFQSSDGNDEALPWLYGISANLVLVRRRKHARHLKAIARLSPSTNADDGAMVRVDQLVDTPYLRAAIIDALLVLPAIERETFLLFAWNGLAYDAIAEALEVPSGTVRSRINRARTRLRISLAEFEKESFHV